MLKKYSICFIILLSLLLSVSPISAKDTPPEYKFYIPIVSVHYRPGMVYIPTGPFLMGCDPDHNDGFACSSFELPLHTVILDVLYIDVYEVTNSQYKQCLDLGGCAVSASDPRYEDPVYANHPAIVRVGDALNYCAWAGKHLPTEEEWEKAARGSKPRAYPWGDQSPTCDLANFNNCVGDTVEVGIHPDGASPYGAMDMAGNAEEWTISPPTSSYSLSGLELTSMNYRVARGGGYISVPQNIRTARRHTVAEVGFLGFRCAASEP